MLVIGGRSDKTFHVRDVVKYRSWLCYGASKSILLYQEMGSLAVFFDVGLMLIGWGLGRHEVVHTTLGQNVMLPKHDTVVICKHKTQSLLMPTQRLKNLHQH